MAYNDWAGLQGPDRICCLTLHSGLPTQLHTSCVKNEISNFASIRPSNKLCWFPKPDPNLYPVRSLARSAPEDGCSASVLTALQSAFPQDGNNKQVGRVSHLCHGSAPVIEKDGMNWIQPKSWNIFLNSKRSWRRKCWGNLIKSGSGFISSNFNFLIDDRSISTCKRIRPALVALLRH